MTGIEPASLVYVLSVRYQRKQTGTERYVGSESLRCACDSYLSWLVNVRKVQGSTVYRYGKVLDEFVAAVGDCDPCTVTGEQIELWMTRVRSKGRVGSAATQRLDRAVVSSLFEFLMRSDVVSKDPTLLVGVPKVRNVQSKALSDEQFVEFWSAELALDERVMFGLGLFAGLRRGEIMSVAPSSFDLGRERIDFMVRKGGSEFGVEYGATVRTVARRLPHLLTEQQAEDWLSMVAELVVYRRDEKVLTPWDLPASESVRMRYSLSEPWLPDPVVMNKRLSKCLRRIGWPREKSFHPHALRHTAATNLARCDVPLDVLADVLSHASTDTTRRYLRGGRLGEWLSKS